jgi:putative membrane protein
MTRALVPLVAVSLVTAAFALPDHAGAHIAVQPQIAAPAATLRTTPRALDDATIIAIFDAANTADIETSGLAAKKGYSKDVRALGSSFAAAHSAVRQSGRDLAKKLGVTPTPPANDKSAEQQAKVMAELRSKSGAAFDLAYLQHEVAFHEAVINAVTTTLLPAIQNPELKKFVTTVAPAFQDHLAMAKKLLSEQTAGK